MRYPSPDLDWAGASVVLACMPWASVYQPSIQLGLLAGRLRNQGIRTEVFFPNLPFADQVGVERYERYGYYDSIFSQWVFSQHLFGSFKPRSETRDFFEFLSQRGVDRRQVDELLRIRDLAGELLDWCLTAIPWRDVQLVGFTTTLMQTLPSLALARALKDRFPTLRVIFGGAGCQGVMGDALMRNFVFIDGLCKGEGEPVIVPLAEALSEGNTPVVPGLIWRADDGKIAPGPPAAQLDMRDYVSPDYEDYFRRRARFPAMRDLEPRIPFEASRGCWWAKVKQCKFCGLNGESLVQRTRPLERVVEELQIFRDRHGVNRFFAMDNILSRDHVNTLPAAFREHLPGCRFFFEVRVTLRRRQMEALAEAGAVDLQPGIESLVPQVLNLVDKGTTPMLNLCFLRRSAELGIRPDWNLLYGFPGEETDWYERLLEQLPLFYHLEPPDLVPFALQRFSPFFDHAGDYGLQVRGCKPGSRYVWDLPDREILDLSFEWSFDLPGRDLKTLGDKLESALEPWRTSKACLKAELTDSESVIIHDTRPIRPDVYLLPPETGRVLRALEAPATVETACNLIRTGLPEGHHKPDRDQLREILEKLINLGLVYRERARYLALCIPTAAHFWYRKPGSESSDRKAGVFRDNELATSPGEQQPFNHQVLR
ncbi:MAG: RiPP maturation radical SAM C-methyltransferase [Acidobacteriota bacterium]|nr:RiPP maturation radical SAM C-methyltransferase [Acidobacteriota bacterium]